MNLCIRIFSSTDICWNICFTLAVRKALCLVITYSQPLKKFHVGQVAPAHIKEHQLSPWFPLGLSPASPTGPARLSANTVVLLAAMFLLLAKRRATGQPQPLLWPTRTRVPGCQEPLPSLNPQSLYMLFKSLTPLPPELSCLCARLDRKVRKSRIHHLDRLCTPLM